MRTILNLGCGNKALTAKPGERVINHDRSPHRPEVTCVHDLNILPWPWPDASCDLIVARAVFEHLDMDLVRSLDECWRLLRPGGQLDLKLPYWRSEGSYDDPTHRWRYTLRSLEIFDPDTPRGKEYGFYTPRKWRILRAPRLNRAQTSIYAVLEVRR